jgi:hypothetical protein
MQYYLYRIQIIDNESNQSLFATEFRDDGKINRSRLFNRIFIDPSQDIVKSNWKIASIEFIETENAVKFDFGKSRIRNKPILKDNKFIVEYEEINPFATIFFDITNEVLAIGHRPEVSPSVDAVARALKKYLNQDQLIKQLEVEIEIDRLTDPNDFIYKLKNSYQVTRFWFNIKLPNAMDSEELIYKPLEETLDPIGAKVAKMEYLGDDLDKDATEDLSRSLASRGLHAGATIKEEEQSKFIKIKLESDPVIIDCDEDGSKNPQNIIKSIRSTYLRIRNG